MPSRGEAHCRTSVQREARHQPFAAVQSAVSRTARTWSGPDTPVFTSVVAKTGIACGERVLNIRSRYCSGIAGETGVGQGVRRDGARREGLPGFVLLLPGAALSTGRSIAAFEIRVNTYFSTHRCKTERNRRESARRRRFSAGYGESARGVAQDAAVLRTSACRAFAQAGARLAKRLEVPVGIVED